MGRATTDKYRSPMRGCNRADDTAVERSLAPPHRARDAAHRSVGSPASGQNTTSTPASLTVIGSSVAGEPASSCPHCT